ncbi:(S)-ureidoglycine aminohydrolase [bacterium]|nr:(S)-ureidoglycine aminohydrolase [bacterium]
MLPPSILSRSRAKLTPYYALLPAEGIVKSTLPAWAKTVARVQAAPQIGARFVQMLLEIEEGGGTRGPISDGLEHFFYVLHGAVDLRVDDQRAQLSQEGYAYVPAGVPFEVQAATAARLIWLKRRYEQIDVPAPAPLFGQRADVTPRPGDVEGAFTQHLLPLDDVAFDMAVNILSFRPGIYFDFVETHIMEHGLYMLEGQGIYYLAGDQHEVQSTDFIWMAPYCPQFFFCTGWGETAYLLYKDVNRDVQP